QGKARYILLHEQISHLIGITECYRRWVAASLFKGISPAHVVLISIMVAGYLKARPLVDFILG
ncbi:MAG: hypothetical protein ACRC1W_07875, partial [Shewanella sp.]